MIFLWEGVQTFLLSSTYFIEGRTDLPQVAIGPLILRKPIATCDFPGRGGADVSFVINIFHRGPDRPSSSSNWTVNSKETNSHL